MAKKLTGAEFIAETLKSKGIDHVFYEELAFYFTTKQLAKYGIKNILAHSEEAAGYMADGYARTTNKTGVCMSQAIGSANLAASVHDAWLANTPVVALTGFKPDSGLQKSGYQESDHRAHFSGVTKYNQQTVDEQQLPHLLRQCFREASTGKPRPVHLDVIGYAGEMAEKAEMRDEFVPEPEFGPFPAKRTGADPETIQKAAALINEAKRPVIVAGRGAYFSDPEGRSLYKLATKGDIPVTTTPDGKTTIDETDPLWSGVVGGYGMDCANQTTTAADLVIYIGSMISDQTTLNFTAPSKDTQILQIDIDGAELGKNYPKTYGVMGDAKTVMDQLEAVIEEKSRNEWRAKVKEFVAKDLARWDANAEQGDGPIQTGFLCKTFSDMLPDDAVISADTGWSATWASCTFRTKPTQKFMRAGGSLGWGFPAAIGAKCGNPDRPVFAFVGDGAFYYHLSELETAVRYGINVNVILNNNSHFNQCIPYVAEAYVGDEAGYEVYRNKVEFRPTNFAAVADAFGAKGFRVTDAKDLKETIEKAMAIDGPTVVEVITDPTCAPVPAFIAE